MKQTYNLPWARVTGPLISNEINDVRRPEIVRRLIQKLPNDSSYFLVLSTEADYRQFLSEGFEPDLEDNYVIDPHQNANFEDGFSRMTRRHIRQAQQKLEVSTLSPGEFMNAYARDLSDRRRKPNAPLNIAHQILDEAMRRGQARIFSAMRREEGELEAAVACLSDDANCYYWLTTRRVRKDEQAKPAQGAIKLLLWSAIRDALAKGLSFDFDGVPADDALKKVGASRLYKGMGARPSVRYRVKRETRLEKIVSPLRTPTKGLIAKTVGRAVALKLNY